MCCCSEESLIDFSKAEVPQVRINFADSNLYLACGCILFAPLYWNIVARYEHRSRFLTRLFGSPYRGCVAVAMTITVLGCIKGWRFQVAIATQPSWPLLDHITVRMLGYVCFVLGSVLVLSSFWALGFYNTYLGDYFGILMERRVTGFPFSLTDDPMYWGSTLNFLATSLQYSSQAGLFMTVFVFLTYKVAIAFEGPFTAMIYLERDKKKL